MNEQVSLFSEQARYCVDTSVILSFLKEDDAEFYGRDVMGPQWIFIEDLIERGIIVAPRSVENELKTYYEDVPGLHEWVKQHRYMFKDNKSNEQLIVAKEITQKYEVYSWISNYVGDLEVMTYAKGNNLTVITLESRHNGTMSVKLPKIPNVCEEYHIAWTTVTGLLRNEDFASQPTE